MLRRGEHAHELREHEVEPVLGLDGSQLGHWRLLADHEAIIRTLRTDLETCATKFQDAGTSDFLTGLMEKHGKMAWMLRAFREE